MPRVVLAEDDRTMVTLLTTLLTMDGFDVSALDADEDVLAAVERDAPDALVLDVHLAHQNGLDVLDGIRRSVSGYRTHIIMISGLNVKDDCLRHGADEFLLKPFMPDDLISMLRNRLQPS